MIINWKKSIFKINEIYGKISDYSITQQADVYCYFQQEDYKEAHRRNSLHKEVKTLRINLQLTEENLRKEMNRTTRYQINKAGRDKLSVMLITHPSKKDIKEFSLFFNTFATEKGIEKTRDNKLEALRLSDCLVISYVKHESGKKLASHLYIATGNRATMLYSASARFDEGVIKPIEIGRANRYLHWQDILFFKDKKYDFYDFLGLSKEENDKEQQNINKFKKGFGGEEITEYQSYISHTFKGNFMLLLLRYLWRNQAELVDRKKIEKNKDLNTKMVK